MIAMATIAIFFFLLVMIYPLVCALLSMAAWRQKRQARGLENESQLLADIDNRTDQLKNLSFKISILLLFFGVAPFLAIWLVTGFS